MTKNWAGFATALRYTIFINARVQLQSLVWCSTFYREGGGGVLLYLLLV